MGTIKLTMGMHYNNPKCRGLITLNGKSLFDGMNKHRKDALIFNYKPGDVLAITEQSTCIVHLYSIDAMADPDLAACSKYSDGQLGQSCWSWAADMTAADTCQTKLTHAGLAKQCCGKAGCKGLPKKCNEQCARLWLPIWEDCSHAYQTNNYNAFSGFCEATKYGKNSCSKACRRIMEPSMSECHGKLPASFDA